MNGEVQQLCRLVNAARTAIAEKGEFAFPGEPYVESVTFDFLPRKTLLGTKPCSAEDPGAWYSQCVSRGLQDIKLLLPLKAGNRGHLGFSNTNRGCIVTFYKNGKVTCWIAEWAFDRTQKAWNVKYQEHVWEKVPQEPLRIEDNAAELEDILLRIAACAEEIGCSDFANVFRSANRILTGETGIPESYPNGKPRWLPDVPKKNQRMFIAASAADVFGAMGSWNDEPAGMAQEKGRSKGYEELSDELLMQIRKAAMYAVNEA